MKSQHIVGIRYIGKKDQQEDTVCKTGAVWHQGQVHNFGSELAAALLVHKDSFEQAELSIDGKTYLTRGNKPAITETAAYVNLSAMSAEQLVLLAKVEFNRVIDASGKDETQVRREVLALMTNHNIDVEAERKKGAVQDDGLVLVPFMATKEEFAALEAGTVVLAIVPAEVVSTAKPSTQDSGDDLDKPVPLNELLDSLEKPDLLAFAKQEGVPFSNSMTAEKLREKIFTELSSRSTGPTE